MSCVTTLLTCANFWFCFYIFFSMLVVIPSTYYYQQPPSTDYIMFYDCVWQPTLPTTTAQNIQPTTLNQQPVCLCEYIYNTFYLSLHVCAHAYLNPCEPTLMVCVVCTSTYLYLCEPSLMCAVFVYPWLRQQHYEINL